MIPVRLRWTTLVIGAGVLVTPAPVGVVEVNLPVNRDAWFSAAGPITTIGFGELPSQTFVTDQYEDLGVFFLDGDDITYCCGSTTYPQDGAGLDGNGGIHLEFLSSHTAIAIDFPGVKRFELYAQGEVVYESGDFHAPNPDGVGGFGGLLSTPPFDEVIIESPVGGHSQVHLDDLHFGGLPAGDLDGDGAVGTADLLTLLALWGPCPGGSACPRVCLGEIHGDQFVGLLDFLALLEAWGPNPGSLSDTNVDGFVDTVDMLTVLGNWGWCPVLFPDTCHGDLDGDCQVGVSDLLALIGAWAVP